MSSQKIIIYRTPANARVAVHQAGVQKKTLGACSTARPMLWCQGRTTNTINSALRISRYLLSVMGDWDDGAVIEITFHPHVLRLNDRTWFFSRDFFA